jgi:hypothetical protein
MTEKVVQPEEERLRDLAIGRIRRRLDFKAHLFAFFVVNGVIVAIWALTGSGFFWPIFPMLGWGIGVAFNAWDVYLRAEPTEEQVLHEMEDLRGRIVPARATAHDAVR